jgi:hypothetical protein
MPARVRPSGGSDVANQTKPQPQRLKPLKLALPCRYHFHLDDACRKPATQVLFFEGGEACTYCDEHGPLKTVVVAVAQLG